MTSTSPPQEVGPKRGEPPIRSRGIAFAADPNAPSQKVLNLYTGSQTDYARRLRQQKTLRGTEATAGHARGSGSTPQPTVPSSSFKKDDDDDFDIDLTYVAPPRVLPHPLDPERTRILYREACAKEGCVTSHKFLRGVARSRVIVGHSGLAAKDIRAMSMALMTDIIVHELYLQGNRIGPLGTRYLAEMFQTNRNIKVLDVSDNLLGIKGAMVLAEIIAENDALLCLRAAGNKFDDNAGVYIGDALQDNTTLRQLDLSRNEFREVGGVHLGQGLSENATLQSVDLSSNHLRNAGMKAMAKAIEENLSIRTLDLSWNGVGLDGAQQIGKALGQNGRLLTLNLRGCRMNIESVINMIKGMQANDTLLNLDITHNPLTNSDAILIVRKLIDSPNLAIQHLQMSSIMVSQEFLKVVEEMQAIRPTFTVAYQGLMGIADKSMNRMDALDLTGGDPLDILIRYSKSKNLRLVDLFSRLDVDKSSTVTRAELVHGVQDAGIPLSIQQMDRLITKVDADGDGEIDFRELLEAYKAYTRKQHKLGIYVRYADNAPQPAAPTQKALKPQGPQAAAEVAAELASLEAGTHTINSEFSSQ